MDATITINAAEITILTFSLSAMVLLVSAQKAELSRLLQIFLILASLFPLASAPRKQDEDELGRVELLDRVLKERSTYKLFLIDSFENQNPWKIYRGNSFLNQTEFIAKTPESSAFLAESNLLVKNENFDTKKSFMIHSFIELPGIDKVEIRPEAPIFLPDGIPIRLQFWAYSENVDMTIKLIIEQKKSSDLIMEIGNLKFDGWKRIEAKLQIPSKNIRLVQSLQIPLKIKAIRFHSAPHQKKGPFFVYLDQMTVLLETSTAIYSGSEIKDNWGD
jgi:hypothetical protein